MIKGKTSTGFEFEVNEKIVNDWRFMKIMAATLSKEDARRIDGYTSLVNLMLGAGGEEKLCAHCTDDDGMIPIDRISDEIMDIMNAINENAKK